MFISSPNTNSNEFNEMVEYTRSRKKEGVDALTIRDELDIVFNCRVSLTKMVEIINQAK